MQKRLLGIVLSLVVVAALVAVLWHCLQEPAANFAQPDDTAGDARVLVATAHDASAARTEPERERVPGDVTPDAVAWQGNESEVSVLVRVVDGVTEQPVAGARVHYWDEASFAARHGVPDDAALRQAGDDEDWLQALGRIAHCDAAGEVRIQASLWSDLRAEFEGSVGVGSIERAGSVRIAILPERNVQVRLLSAERKPVAGVDVGIWLLDAAGAPLCDDPVRRVLTDPAGMAHFRHLQWPSGDDPALREPAACAVRPMAPGCKDVFVRFAPNTPPSEPIELVMPQVGTLVIRWPAGSDRSFLHAWVNEVGDCWWRTGDGRREARDLVFRHVAIGRNYEVYANSQSRRVDGPRIAGEVVLVELADAPFGSLACAVVDAAGRVLAERDCVVCVQALYPYPPKQLRTDAAGRLVYALPQGWTGRPFRCVVEVLETDDESTRRAPAVEGVIRDGVNDLGVLRVDAVEPVVSGRIVQVGDGEPLRPRLRVERRAAADGSWWEIDGLRTKFTETGFTILGYVAADGPLRLRCADRELIVGGPREIQLGQRDVVLEVRPAVPFEVRARFDEVLAPRIEVELCSRDLTTAEFASLGLPPGAPVRVRCFDLVGDRAVYSDDVPAGTYDLQLKVRGFPEVLARVDRVVVGGERPDPRLLEVDLRGKLATLVVDVVDGNGEPQDARITALGATNLGQESRQDFGSGETLLVPAGPRDLLVFWPDYPPVEVRAASGRVRVQVSPWRSSDIVVAGLPTLPVGFAYELEVGDVQPRDWSKYASYLSCIGQLQCLENGRARVQFGDGPSPVRLRISRNADAATEDLPPLQLDRIVASDTPIELQAPAAAAILAALESLQARPLKR